jgi:hypothetical protein
VACLLLLVVLAQQGCFQLLLLLLLLLMLLPLDSASECQGAKRHQPHPAGVVSPGLLLRVTE